MPIGYTMRNVRHSKDKYMNEKIKENLHCAQKNMLCLAFDADYKKQHRGIALELLMTIELLLTPINKIIK